MSPKELDDLLGVCRKHGVTVFTDGNIRIAFGPSGAPLQPTPGMQPVPPPTRPMTDWERFLFAATDGYIEDDHEAVVPVQADMKQ